MFTHPRLKSALLFLCVLAGLNGRVTAGETETRTVATFDGAQRPANWGVNFGHWEPADGVLVARELAADKHAAASRWRIPMQDGVVTLKLQFDGGKFFHVGFDPAPGELAKKGHLYSLIITPQTAQLKLHKDKADKTSREQVVATASIQGDQGAWLDVQLRTEGNQVTATVGTARLSASHPTFHVAKPTVVFRVGGGDVKLDDVEVRVLKAAELKPAAKKKNG